MARLAPSCRGHGSPFSNNDSGHRLIESLTVMSRFPSEPQELAGFRLDLAERWVAKALHDWCKTATQLNVVNPQALEEHLRSAVAS